jgi:thiamine phosphate synthase YjbQ (UPF0047 family)
MPREVQPEEAPWTVFSDVVGLRTERKEQLIDLTELVAERVRRSGVWFGLASVQAPPASLAVRVEADRRLGGEGGRRGPVPSVTLPVAARVLQRGRGQRLFLAESDGPRPRQVQVLVLGLPGLS